MVGAEDCGVAHEFVSMRLDSLHGSPFFVRSLLSTYVFEIWFGPGIWIEVTVLGKEQEDDDTQKDFCARGRTLHG